MLTQLISGSYKRQLNAEIIPTFDTLHLQHVHFFISFVQMETQALDTYSNVLVTTVTILAFFCKLCIRCPNILVRTTIYFSPYRKINVPSLNDASYVGLSIYNCCICAVVAMPLSLFNTQEIGVTYAIVGGLMVFCTTVSLCMLFIPKVRLIVDEFMYDIPNMMACFILYEYTHKLTMVFYFNKNSVHEMFHLCSKLR